MALHVTLVKDALKGEGALRPRVVQTNIVDMDLLMHYMANGTALEPADMRAAISRFNEALVFYLGQGGKVATPIGTFLLSARGTYIDGETPRVDPFATYRSRHAANRVQGRQSEPETRCAGYRRCRRPALLSALSPPEEHV